MDYYQDTKPPLSAMGRVVESIGMEPDTQIDNHLVHEQCCRCSVCGVSLEEKCHEKGGQLYCQEHYFRDCSPYRCAGCKTGIAPSDMVYKLRTGMVFHVSCHCCVRCGRQLSPGEQIIVDEAAKTVACMHHFYGEQAPCVSTFPSCSTDAPPYSQEMYNEFNVKKEVDQYGYSFDGFAFSDFCDDDGKFLKRRGPRTTIKQNQLDVLNRIFSTTPKPSKHARAKLALETGLNMRVIQVWFQNRRSKERRLKHLCNYLRHYEQRGLIAPPINFPPEGGSCDLSSFPMIPGMEAEPFEDDDDDV